MDKADRISGSFWLIFAVIVCIESYRLGLGTLRSPGPGFLFFWTGIVLGIMSLVLLSGVLRSKRAKDLKKPIFGKVDLKKIILVLVSVFLYTLLMEILGFIPVTLLLFALLLGIIEKKGWLITIVTSVIVTFTAYLLFNTWLKTQLPKGLFGFLRF